MIKKAIVLNGSPRTTGNTAVMLDWFGQAMKNKDWKIEQIDLWKLDFKGCAHCDKCKKIEDKPGCALDDDLTDVLDKIINAEAVILASPVYCWAVTGCLSAALDRFYCLFKPGGSIVKEKKFGGIFTSGGDSYDGMELCVDMARRLAAFGGSKYVGTAIGTSCTTPAKTALRQDIKKSAEQLAALLE